MGEGDSAACDVLDTSYYLARHQATYFCGTPPPFPHAKTWDATETTPFLFCYFRLLGEGGEPIFFSLPPNKFDKRPFFLSKCLFFLCLESVRARYARRLALSTTRSDDHLFDLN